MRLMQGALGASLRYGLGAILPDLWHWRRGGVFAVGGAEKQKSAGAIGVFTVYGAAVEYFGSLFQELCFGSVSWDYSEHMLNLGGRVSLKMAFMWGVLGIVFMRFAFPWISRLLEKMKGTGWRIACVAMTVFMAVNLLVTSAAITRWKTRTAGEPANNPVAQWLDDTYGDQTMARLFPNMQFTE